MSERGIGREASRQGHTPIREGKNYFLGIGISKYDERCQLYPLPNAQKDVSNLEDVLFRRYKYSRDETTELLINEQASKTQLNETLKRFVNDLTKEDSLVVYFAGHGVYEENHGYWCLYDYDEERTTPFKFLDTEITGFINDIECDSILIVEDRCQGNSIPESAIFSSNKTDGRCIQVISSTGTYDLASDGDDIIQNSPFARAFIALLEHNNNEEFSLTKQNLLNFDNNLSTLFIRNIYHGNSAEDFRFKLRIDHYPFLKESTACYKYYNNNDNLSLSLIDKLLTFYPGNEHKVQMEKKRRSLKNNGEKKWKKLRTELLKRLIKYHADFHYDKKYEKQIKTINSLIDQLIGEDKKEVINQIDKEYQMMIENVLNYREIIPTYKLSSYKFSTIYDNIDNDDWITSIFEYGTTLISVEQMHHFFILNLKGKNEYIERYDSKWQSFDDTLLNEPAIFLTRIEALKFANWYSEKNKLTPYYRMLQDDLVGLDINADGYRLPTYDELKRLIKHSDFAFKFTKDEKSLEWCWDFHDTEDGIPHVIYASVSKNNNGHLEIDDYETSELEKYHHIGFRLVKDKQLTTSPE